MAEPTINILPSFGHLLTQEEKVNDQTLTVTTTNVENTQSVIVSFEGFTFVEKMANNFAVVGIGSTYFNGLIDAETYTITASITNIYGETAIGPNAEYDFTVFPFVGISQTADVSGGITIKDEGTVVGTAGSVTSIDFVGSNVIASASGAGSTITIIGEDSGTIGIQSGGVLVGSAGTINFAGTGIGTVSVANDIAVITVSGDYGEFGDS